MGFFNDLREDLANAVNQLTDDKSENEIEVSSKQLKDEITKKDKKNKKDRKGSSNLEQEIKEYLNVSETPDADEKVSDSDALSNQNEPESVSFENIDNQISEAVEDVLETDASAETEITGNGFGRFSDVSSVNDTEESEIFDENTDGSEAIDENSEISEEFDDTVDADEVLIEEEYIEAQMDNNAIKEMNTDNNDFTIISKGTVIKGGIETTGSIEINGCVEGDVKANGEFILSGIVNGSVEALIISVNAGKIKGNVKAFNGIYISENSVIIGDIEATEAEIGGAVKGKIDVNGPVILKSEAKVLGDIDCKSVQIDNGGVIEGKCSQKYADVSPSAFFENL